ncbi:hypothetical protein HY338_02190, partial [Candidatus Gottesmanbacteria bacterium]|nr:hypothetical protein [Candidatus Gottesmanbacteria bacterium]
MQITVSTPGKIILSGEHTVVYGFPAILTAINRRLYVTVRSSGKSDRRADDIKIINANIKDDRLVRKSIEVFRENFKIDKLLPLEMKISTDIPPNRGLGSSASLSSAVIGALMKGILNIWNPLKINELSFIVEKNQHANPSGADNTIVTFGGLIWYRKEFDFLKSIWSLPISQYKFPPFIFIDSGSPVETTGEMVEKLGILYQKQKKKMEEIFYSQETETKKMLMALKQNNLKDLQESIEKTETNLEKMEVVGPYVKNIINKIRDIGGVAKVSGGGGYRKASGMLICFHPTPSKIYALTKKLKLPSFPLVLGEEGIRIEKQEKSK